MSLPSDESRHTKRRFGLLPSILLFLATSLVAAANFGCYTGYANRPGGMATGAARPSGAGTAAGAWYRHPTGAASSVEIPYAPRAETTRVRLDSGARMTTVRGVATIGELTFMALSHEFEGGIGGNPLTLLDELLDAFLADAEGLEIVAADASWKQGHPGTVLELQNEDQSRRLVVHQYVGRSHAYLYAYAVPAASTTRYAPFEQHFFASIVLDPSDAPSPAGTGVLDTGTWSWVYPPEAEFAAEMPGSPRREESSFTIAGERYTTLDYLVRGADARTVMRVRYIPIEHDAWPEDILAVMSADACRDGGVLRMSGPVTRTGYGGQKLVVDTPTTVRFVIQIMRFNGIFEITHEMPRTEETSSLVARRRFFNSFMFP